jgi:hypothetical protein
MKDGSLKQSTTLADAVEIFAVTVFRRAVTP